MKNWYRDYEEPKTVNDSVAFIDFGAAFGSAGCVCDYTPCIDAISRFVPTVASLLGREIRPDEFKLCERMLRNEYLSHRPFCNDREVDDHIYKSPWEMDDGTQICIHVVLLKRNSIKVLTADKKMSVFVVCDEAGQQIGTMRTLPWNIVNISEISYALRNIMQGHFPHELLGSRLAAAWRDAGGNDDLPATIYLTEMPDCSALSIRFAEVSHGVSDEIDDVRKARASILIDDIEVAIRDLQPPMLQRISLGALDEDSMVSFYDMKGCVASESYRDWLFVRLQRYDYLVSFQNQYAGCAGVVPAMLQGGEMVEVFHTGDISVDGKAIYGLCRDYQDGRWSDVVWTYAEHLKGIGIEHLPVAPNWGLKWHVFEANGEIGALSRHVLHNAYRWASQGCLTGKKDVHGHDIFVDEVARKAMYDKACTELGTSLRYAVEHPDRIIYGYYHPAVDRAVGDISPIAIYLPAFFSEESKRTAVADAVFAVRAVNDGGHIRYEVPTILPPSFARRTMDVLGTMAA